MQYFKGCVCGGEYLGWLGPLPADQQTSTQQRSKPATLKHAVARQHTPGVSIESTAVG